MPQPPARFLSRGGLLSSVRRLLGANDRSSSDITSAIDREIGRATKALRDELRDAHRDAKALDAKLQEADGVIQSLTKELSEARDRQKELRNATRLFRAVLSANKAGHSERHAGAMHPQEVSAHIASAIAAAPLELTPMPHIVVEHLLPAATYSALLDATPPDECFSDRDPVKQNFRPAQAKVVPDFTAAMWAFTEETMVAGVLVPALMARFRPHIDALYLQRYGERATQVSALPHEATAGRLMLRRPGYHLDPHVDPQRVVVTCLLYLANPGDSVAFGTQLFSLNEVPTIRGTKTYYPSDGGYTSSLVKTVPFTPNTAVAFLNAGAAAHGATIPESAPKDTKRYAYQFYVSPDATGLAAVIGETADSIED